ncbi:MAG: hypothetical protein KatS3mg035_1296 [Bacteroidia bacterium]|nr:MAG: hypothetical protein KatS3mg035_1296 [Bacteroidia bacterium]
MRCYYGFLWLFFFLVLVHPVSAQKKSKKNKNSTEVISSPVISEKKDSVSKKLEEVPIIEGAQIVFEKETHDFGKIIQGDIVRYQFKFKNVGNKDLIISDVKGSCGCTVTQFPKHPIKPNQESTIDVSFNSAAKMGPQNKNLTVYTNAEPSLKILYIKGEVISPSAPTYLQQQKSN